VKGSGKAAETDKSENEQWLKKMLLDEGWSAEQAQAIVDKLMLKEGIPDWKPHHLKRFEEWCVAERKSQNEVDSQLEFVAHDLCNEHEAIGMSLKLARNLEEAKAAIVPYARMLGGEADWYRPSRRRI
jgi:hypothetical protein